MSDAELIELARNGDRAAFGDLVERYQQVVFRTALAALRSREDAEEVAQDAMVSAFRKLGSFRGDASFKTWLLTITWNRAMDRRRRVGEWFRRFVSPDADHGFEFASAAPSHEETLVARESRKEVRRLLEGCLREVERLCRTSPVMVTTIPPPTAERAFLVLSASGDHTFEQIGRLLGIPTGTAKWRAAEGRRLLKKRLISRGIRAAG